MVEGEAHGAMSCLENIYLIDYFPIHAGDAVANLRVRGEDGKIFFALLFCELFGVIQASQLRIQAALGPVARENDCGRGDRASQRSAARLIDARHMQEALLPKLSLEGQSVPKSGTHTEK